jgi:ABC-type nitrate/sulfonate/bicarbonate transport system substrate-binding protein
MKISIICGLALAAFATLLAQPGGAAEKLVVGKASPNSPAMLPVDVGVKTGIFAKHGLDVEISVFGGGAKLHQAMAAGSVGIGVGAGPELALIAKGSPELAICNSSRPPVFLAIVVPADSKVRSPDELKGAKIGVTTTGSLTYWLAREFARQRGWGPEGVTTVTIGGEASATFAAFRTHSVDAVIVATSLAFQLEENKEGRLLLTVDKFVGNMSSGTIFASKELMDKNPDTIRRFLAGWFDTVDFMRKNKAETVRIASEMTGFSQSVQAKEYDLTMPMFNDDGKFEKESLDTLKRSFADLKLLDFDPDMTKLYTEAYLPKR